jgi:butyryl-CoA dehydrogenase
MSVTENRQRIQTIAEAFAEKFLEPVAAELDRSGNFPRAIFAQLARKQLLALPVARHAGFVAHVETLRTLSHACPAAASIVNHHALAAYAVFKWGSAAQKTLHLARLAEGEQLGALAFPDSGAEALTGAGGGTLNGKASFVRNAGVADVYICFATITGPAALGPVAFIAEGRTAGISVGPRYRTMGLRGCPVADVTFRNVALDPACILGSAEDGPAILSTLLAAKALGTAAQTVGIGQTAARQAAASAERRVQFGHPIATLQPILAMLEDITTDLHLAWLGILHAAQCFEDGVPFIAEAERAQSFLGRVGQQFLIDAIQIEGGLGISETPPPHHTGAIPLARMFRDMAGTTLCDTPVRAWGLNHSNQGQGSFATVARDAPFWRDDPPLMHSP